jgi:hypothetical protein
MMKRWHITLALVLAVAALGVATGSAATSPVTLNPRLSFCLQDAYHGKVFFLIRVRNNSSVKVHYKKDDVRAIWKRAYESGVKDSWANTVTLEADVPANHRFTFRGSFGADGKKQIIACWLHYDGSNHRVPLIR